MATTWHEPQQVQSPQQRAGVRLLELTVQRDHWEREVETRVREARAVGCTWQQIGTALGMTKQGAHFRFGGDGAA